MTAPFLLLLSALCLVARVHCSVTTNFHIEHSLDGGVTFRKRSSFQHNGKGEIAQSSASAEIITQEEIESFKALLATNSMYTLRIHAQADNCSSAAVYAVIPAVRQFTLLTVPDQSYCTLAPTHPYRPRVSH